MIIDNLFDRVEVKRRSCCPDLRTERSSPASYPLWRVLRNSMKSALRWAFTEIGKRVRRRGSSCARSSQIGSGLSKRDDGIMGALRTAQCNRQLFWLPSVRVVGVRAERVSQKKANGWIVRSVSETCAAIRVKSEFRPKKRRNSDWSGDGI